MTPGSRTETAREVVTEYFDALAGSRSPRWWPRPTRWRCTGASGAFDGSGRFQGLTPNGRHVEIRGLDLLMVEDGKIVSNYAYTNGMEFARQVGALPAQDSPPEKALAAAFNAKTALEKRLRSS